MYFICCPSPSRLHEAEPGRVSFAVESARIGRLTDFLGSVIPTTEPQSRAACVRAPVSGGGGRQDVNTLLYKSCVGVFGRARRRRLSWVVGLRDVIHFAGGPGRNCAPVLAEGVEDYLAMCVEAGIAPEKPDSGRLMVRVTPIHHRARRTREPPWPTAPTP